MNIFKEPLRILANTEVANSWYEMKLSLSIPQTTELKNEHKHIDGFTQPKPGQFLSISFEHLLYRRPFAISNFEQNTSISILYKIQHNNNKYLKRFVKNATNSMVNLNEHDSVDVMGYHGNSFTMPNKDDSAILVAGGIGIGPLLYFYKVLKQRNYSNTRLIVGATTKNHLPKILLPADAELCTDDGSAGFHGTSIDYLKQELAQNDNKHKLAPILYFCGPLAMMKAGAVLAETYNLPAYASLDTTMACAMGTCVGCVVPIKHEKQTIGNTGLGMTSNIIWKKACTSGPIFLSKDIAWQMIK